MSLVLLYPSNNTWDVLTNLPSIMVSFSFYVALIVNVPHISSSACCLNYPLLDIFVHGFSLLS